MGKSLAKYFKESEWRIFVKCYQLIKRKIFRCSCFFCLDSTKSTELVLMAAPYRAVLRMFHRFPLLLGPGQLLPYKIVFCYVQVGSKACNYLIFFVTWNIWLFIGILFPPIKTYIYICSEELYLLEQNTVPISFFWRHICQIPCLPASKVPWQATYLCSIRSA